MTKFIYDGPVKAFSKRIINPKWSGETMAESRKKALSNLSFQYKKEKKMAGASSVTLDDHFLYEEG